MHAFLKPTLLAFITAVAGQSVASYGSKDCSGVKLGAFTPSSEAGEIVFAADVHSVVAADDGSATGCWEALYGDEGVNCDGLGLGPVKARACFVLDRGAGRLQCLRWKAEGAC